MRALNLLLAAVLLLVATTGLAGIGPTATASSVFLPLLAAPGGAQVAPAGEVVVHAPYHPGANLDDKLGELAIFWFGKVNQQQNYADVRVGYTESELFVYVAIFDRRLWYDETPQAVELSAWDAVTLYLDTDGGSTLDASSHRFVAQLSGDPSPAHRAAYRISGSGWLAAATPFTTRPGWRGESLNSNGDARGWAMTYRIPFASMGGRPAEGSLWRMAMVLHDRDSAAGPPLPDQLWPPGARLTAPPSWGNLRFGLPHHLPAATATRQTFLIRHGLNGAVVPDAAVGGGTVCGDGLDFWGEWGDSRREAGKGDFNIQNQSDVADWPCFSKYFVTFPLHSLPAGRAVVSATLVLHQFGNADPSKATPSLIQTLSVGADWDERTISWNNAPLALENAGGGWVAPIADFGSWPGVRRELDVSHLVAQAYADGTPLRLALYSADSDYHSGKYFVSSDTGDWNAEGRPTLIITLGTPAEQ